MCVSHGCVYRNTSNKINKRNKISHGLSAVVATGTPTITFRKLDRKLDSMIENPL